MSLFVEITANIYLGQGKIKKSTKKIVSKCKSIHYFKLYAYCVMDNNAHLLIEVCDIPLSKIMQGIQQVFTQHYKRKNRCTGHIFEQRYKSFLCDKDTYLLSLTCYIHQNPVRSKLAHALNCQWSNHQEYIGNQELADVNFPLNLFTHYQNKAIKRYLSFMDEMETKEVKSMI